MQAPFFVLLDNARQQTATLYEGLVHIDAFQADQLLGLDEHGSLQSVLEQHWQKAWHAVVWAPYGFGRELMGLDPLLEKAGAFVKELVEKGRLTVEEGKELQSELKRKGEDEAKELLDQLDVKTKTVQYATKEDVSRLEDKLDALLKQSASDDKE